MIQSSTGRNRIPVAAPDAGEHEGNFPLVLLRTLRALLLVLAALALTLSLPSFAKSVRPEPQTSPEALLNRAFEDIGRQHIDAALGHIEALIRARPNFRLAHFIKGDLLLAKARPLATLGNAPNGPADRIVDLREEAVARLRAYREPHSSDQIPRYLLQLLPEQKYAIVVDTGRSRLYLFKNEGGQPRYAGDYYISTGKRGALKLRAGDQKTPIGVYHVTSSLPRKKLSDFYGDGAFPINYPNEWDRRHGRNGRGIWLHGTPSDTYSRPPRASDGCVVLSNSDLDALATHLQIGLTPVIISEGVEWLSVEEWKAERRSFLQALDTWRADWESMDTDRYLGHYSPSFAANGEARDAWGRHKRQVNSAKSWVKVGVSDLSLFRMPGKEDVVVVTFSQNYRSNNLSNVMKKRQYWLREGGRWRIVYEGAA
jgi:murein L,D-transpeptidase YafK